MQAQALAQRASFAFHNQGLPPSALLSRSCAVTGRRPVMLQQKRKRSLPRNLPWQATIGAAFCATVWLCARKRRSKSQRTKTKTRASTASPPTQLDGQFTRDTSARQEDLGSQLPPLSVLLVDEHLNCSVEQLWSIICQPDPAFQHTIHTLSGNRDIQYGSWSQKDGVLCREETYINPLKKNSLGPKEAFCLDQQRCVQKNTSGFVIERKVFTPKVPFGGSFHNKVLWCAWCQPGSQRVHLQISCDVVFTGRFIPAKGIINSSSLEGMERFYKMWIQQLHLFIDTLGAAGKLNTGSGKRQQVSLQADSAISSQSISKGKPQQLSQGLNTLPVMLLLLALGLWLMYDKLVLLRKQELVPYVSAAISMASKMLPQMLPEPDVGSSSQSPLFPLGVANQSTVSNI